MKLSTQYLNGILDRSELLHSVAEVESAFDRMARDITEALDGKDPIVFCVMNGGVIPTVKLLDRLQFPLRQDYVHATRYNEGTVGDKLTWLHRPEERIEGEYVLLIDDILDEGITLAALAEACSAAGAAKVYTAVLVDKVHDRKNGFTANFVGLHVPDRYIYGCGMDFKGYLRNVRGIFAVSDADLAES